MIPPSRQAVPDIEVVKWHARDYMTNEKIYDACPIKIGMEWNGMEWNGIEWNRIEWNGIEWNRME